MKKVKISKKQLKQIFAQANEEYNAGICKDLKEWFPKLFLEKKVILKPKNEIGWYISTLGNLVYNDGVEDYLSGVYKGPCLSWNENLITQSDFQKKPHWRLAKKEETLQILSILALKKGFVKGVKISWEYKDKSIDTGVIDGDPYWAFGSKCLSVPVKSGVGSGLNYLPLFTRGVCAKIIK